MALIKDNLVISDTNVALITDSMYGISNRQTQKISIYRPSRKPFTVIHHGLFPAGSEASSLIN